MQLIERELSYLKGAGSVSHLPVEWLVGNTFLGFPKTSWRFSFSTPSRLSSSVLSTRFSHVGEPSWDSTPLSYKILFQAQSFAKLSKTFFKFFF